MPATPPPHPVEAISLEPALGRARTAAARPGPRAGSPPDGPTHRRSLTAARVLLLWLWAAHAAPARADLDSALPTLGVDGLNGGRHVASGLDTGHRSLRFAGSLGYGYTENVLGAHDHHHRAAGELAVAALMAPWLQASLAGELRIDRHAPEGPGRETGLLGSTRLATRHVLPVGEKMAIGLTPRVHFPGAESPARGLRAASYELSALFSARLPRSLELSLNAGYRRDRSRLAHADALALPAAQRLAAAMTDEKNACLLGALLVAPLAGFRLSAEWSWELLLDAPVRPSESPMRMRAALQRVLGDRFLPGLELGVDVSSRPRFVGLTRVEPRIWARLTLAVLIQQPAARPTPAPLEARLLERPPAPQPEPLRAITLRIVDAQGDPIVGAHISVPGGARDAYISGDDGSVTLQVPAGVTAVTIEASGFEPIWRTLARELDETAVVLEPELPAAEIKGVVRNLAGDAILATVTVLPQGMTVSTDARGQFAIGVAPGDYTLKIAADGYEPQERRAQVELRGVTIVVIDLQRANR